MIEEKLPEDLLRSQSSPGTERFKDEAAHGDGSLLDRDSALLDINKAPADFVVVRGQKYKVSKTTPSSNVIPSESNDRTTPKSWRSKVQWRTTKLWCQSSLLI